MMNIKLWWAMVLTAVLDAITTMVGMNMGLIEGNFIMSYFISTFGLALGLAMVKVVAILAITVIVRYAPSEERGRALKIPSAMWLVLAVWNAALITSLLL